MSPGAGGGAVTGERSRGAAEEGRGIAEGKCEAEPKAVNDEDDGAGEGDDGGDVAEEGPDDAATSSPSCDPWTPRGWRPSLGGAAGSGGPASAWISGWR